MRSRVVLLVSFNLIILSCNQDNSKSTRGAYSTDEVLILEQRASADDREALRELDIFYGMEGRSDDRNRIHSRRLEINDKEAIEEEAMKFLIAADRENNCAKRLPLLIQSKNIILRYFDINSDNNISQDPTYKLVVERIAESGCHD